MKNMKKNLNIFEILILFFVSLYQQSYLHLSRHEHAKRRARGPGGRFASGEKSTKSKGTKLSEQKMIEETPPIPPPPAEPTTNYSQYSYVSPHIEEL
jgi:hypothetical protein